jgi:hypothetical protein
MTDRWENSRDNALELVPHSASKLRSLYLLFILMAVIFGGMLAGL